MILRQRVAARGLTFGQSGTSGIAQPRKNLAQLRTIVERPNPHDAVSRLRVLARGRHLSGSPPQH